MAAEKWIAPSNGRIVRWRKSHTDDRPGSSTWLGVPPHWYRNQFNRRERRRARRAIVHGDVQAAPYVHPRVAGWYW
jgi:hypothetical protein